MGSRFSAVLRNRKFTAVVLGLVGLLAVGLIAVAGVTLYNKMQARPAPSPTAALPPVHTPVAAGTPLPTATLVVAAASPTVKVAATAVPTQAATAKPTSVPTQPAPTVLPTAVPGADGGVPNTGASLLPALLAGGGFAMLLVSARSGRRRGR